MPETRVTMLGDGAQHGRQLGIRVNGQNANFVIKSDRIEATFLRNIDARLSDFLDIASAIFAADGRISRGGPSRSQFGRDWRRSLAFTFAVRDPAFWRQPRVTDALRDAVEFMSEDSLQVDFVQAMDLSEAQSVLDVGAGNPVFDAEEVVLFSGGLDSLAGAVDRLVSGPGKVILLSHVSATKRVSYAKQLVDCLKERFPGRILWVPVAAHLKGEEARETTQRTRSLLFACLGFVTARLSGARKLSFYENGIVSANLPISAQVIGTMASRTTHPQTIAKIAALFEAIDPGQVKVANPYGALSKAQVATRLANLGGGDLIRHTVSCSHVRPQTILHPHCGDCSQCLDRRFGILAAGLEALDPAEGYETEVLTDPRPTDTMRILALDWVRHALWLSEASDGAFLGRFGSELSRLIAGRPDLPDAEHARAIIAMHRAHGAGVRSALVRTFAANSDALIAGTLDPTSLLRMIAAERTGPPVTAPDPPIAVDDAAAEVAANDAVLRPAARIRGSATSASVTIHGLGEVSGAIATPAWALMPFHLEDSNSERAPDQFRFVPGGEVARSLNADKATVRQRIKRLRKEFADYYKAIEGFPPDEPILIQSKGTREYRLDPRLVIDGDPPPDDDSN